MAQVLALVDNLFFQVKMMETARQVGVELRTCGTPDALLAEVAKQARQDEKTGSRRRWGG